MWGSRVGGVTRTAGVEGLAGAGVCGAAAIVAASSVRSEAIRKWRGTGDSGGTGRKIYMGYSSALNLNQQNPRVKQGADEGEEHCNDHPVDAAALGTEKNAPQTMRGIVDIWARMLYSHFWPRLM